MSSVGVWHPGTEAMFLSAHQPLNYIIGLKEGRPLVLMCTP